ncbi:MAG: methyltransferase domain-containing protein [Chloroflexi bacterium]|nr:methyltransferase domain-containing protein [Chloroflexota bacterium]
MDNQAWHQRFVLQSLRTKQLRNYLLNQINLDSNSKILEVGSGTGALLSENLAISQHVFGIDFDHARNIYAKILVFDLNLSTADAYQLPFPNNSFDFCFCHYLLLWLKHPTDALKEMRRVTRQGGFVIAFAEPDYDARIDYPEIFKEIGTKQNKSLKEQGIQLNTGRRLKELFLAAGFTSLTMGMLSGEWKIPNQQTFDLEWEIISYDLSKTLSQEAISTLEHQAHLAYGQGTALTFIPTFYAIAEVM